MYHVSVLAAFGTPASATVSWLPCSAGWRWLSFPTAAVMAAPKQLGAAQLMQNRRFQHTTEETRGASCSRSNCPRCRPCRHRSLPRCPAWTPCLTSLSPLATLLTLTWQTTGPGACRRWVCPTSSQARAAPLLLSRVAADLADRHQSCVRQLQSLPIPSLACCSATPAKLSCGARSSHRPAAQPLTARCWGAAPRRAWCAPGWSLGRLATSGTTPRRSVPWGRPRWVGGWVGTKPGWRAWVAGQGQGTHGAVARLQTCVLPRVPSRRTATPRTQVRFVLGLLEQHPSLPLVVVSDSDTVWLRAPWPYLEQRPAAEFFISTDCLSHEVGTRRHPWWLMGGLHAVLCCAGALRACTPAPLTPALHFRRRPRWRSGGRRRTGSRAAGTSPAMSESRRAGSAEVGGSMRAWDTGRQGTAWALGRCSDRLTPNTLPWLPPPAARAPSTPACLRRAIRRERGRCSGPGPAC